jgi:TonB-linked SusC/RagA family outer membrane protein
MAALCLNFRAEAQSQNPPPLLKNQAILGKVISATTGETLPGAVIKVTATNHTVISNDKGEFILTLGNGTYNLSIHYLSYKTKNISIQIPLKESLIIAMDTDNKNLKEVEIVSTGYQNIPKERATGSFTIVDNKTFDRAVSPDVLSRLQGISNGLLFDASTSALGISIRGRSTIFSSTKPLVVVDNFPFEGDINTLNPNDIESVTILKDAAAAAIWGTRAGNGAIVITTKKGIYNQPTTITANANLIVSNKPDLYYQKQLSSNEFIDVEKFLFDKGKYTSTINNGYATISPVVDILQKQKVGQLTLEEANTAIDKFRNLDIRDQLDKYYYRPDIHQQYHLSVRGGSSKQTYFIAGGLDKSSPAETWKSNDRLTFKANNTYKLLKEKLSIAADLSFSTTKNKTNGIGYTPFLPYEQIADKDGAALSVVKSNGLRESFTDNVGNGLLLDWKYRPLDELRNNTNSAKDNETDYRLNLGLDYKIFEGLTITLNYQYYRASGLDENYSALESFATRNIINSPSYLDNVSGQIIRPIPLGGILRTTNRSKTSNAGRSQLNFNKTISNVHEINAIAGYELREDKSDRNSNTLYGYIPERASALPVNQTANFPNYYIPGNSSTDRSIQGWDLDRNISYYLNASYGYKNRYIISGSFRKDESNLFGVKSNQKGVPLWSTGMLWNLHNEDFLRMDFLNTLKLRATYGYNGNVNKDVTAYLTAAQSNFTNSYNQNYADIQNPPNEALRWERVENINVGLDFSLAGNRLSGTFELFVKNGKDLIGTSPIALQTGLISFTGNVADIKTRGFDIQLNTLNIDRIFKWETTFIFNKAKDKVTNYMQYAGVNANIAGAIGINPIKGYPVNSIFAYKWAGLDQNGNPQGLLNNNVSKDYAGMSSSTNINNLDFLGSASPTYYGSVRNTFTYKFIQLSFNLTYKLGYFIRRSSLSYNALFNGSYTQPDFNKRWQKPGDELNTNIPSMVYPNNASRESFFRYSSTLVEKGDHLRIQDLQLNFNLTKKEIRQLPLQNLNLYAYVTNLGVLWRSSKNILDPDVRSGYPNPLSIAFGIKTNF